jgi:hypothetical protein
MQHILWKNLSATPVLAVLFGLTTAACLVSVRYPDSEPSAMPLFLAALASAFACYFSALLLLRTPDLKLPAAWVVAVAVAIQVAPLRSTPLFDRDAYRYHWDGKLLAEGTNPYRYAPGDHALVPMRDEYWPLIEHKGVKTAYPPLAAMALAGTYLIDRTPARAMYLAVGFNLLSLLPLLMLLRRRRVADKWLALYAWNPLIATEFGAGGHLDAISIFFVLVALCALELDKLWSAGGMLALGVMGKTQMLLVAPLVLWRSGWRGALAFLAVGAVVAGPFLAAGTGNVLSGAVMYLQFWEYNSGVFALLRYIMGDLAARTAVIAAVFALMAFLTFREGDVALHAGLLLAAVLLLGPTLYPWYSSWALPFASLYPTVTAPVATLMLLVPKLGAYGKGMTMGARAVEVGVIYTVAVAEYAMWRRRRAAQAGLGETPAGPPAAP